MEWPRLLDSKLQGTVLAYAECGMRVETAARKLGVSGTTVADRLLRVQIVTGRDPRDFWDLAWLVGLRRKEENR